MSSIRLRPGSNAFEWMSFRRLAGPLTKSARWHVAQVSNLLDRSASSLQTLIGICRAHALPIGNRRSSRLETCATTLSVALWRLVVCFCLGVAPHFCKADEMGIPTAGDPGVTETISEIMGRQKNLPLQSSLKPGPS